MNEQAPDSEAGKTTGAPAPGGELRRDRKALRGAARTESAARRPLFGRSRPDQADAAHGRGGDEDAGVDASDVTLPDSPFAALNLEPELLGGPPTPPLPPVPASVESPPFPVAPPQVHTADGAVPDFDAPLFETPAYEQPAFSRRTFEPPQEAPQPDTDRFRPPAADLPAPDLPADLPAPDLPVPTVIGTSPAVPGPADPGRTGASSTNVGPLRPTPREVPAELAVLDTAAMITAVVLPPIGLILSIVASIRGRLYRGWTSNLARTAFVVSIIMMIVFALGGAYLWAEQKKLAEEQAAVVAAAAARDGIVAESAPFCGALAANPTIFGAEDPDYGWPLVDDPAGYLPAIANYNAVWQSLVPLAPSGIATQVQSFSDRINGIVGLASSLQATNRTGDLLGVHQSDDITTIASYVGEYCE